MQTYLIGLIIAFGIIAISFILHFFSISKNKSNGSNRSSSISNRYDPWNNNEMPFELKWGGKNQKKRVKYLKN